MSDLSEAGREATEALVHYGVKGMKWGVRKGRDSPLRVGDTRKDFKEGRKDTNWALKRRAANPAFGRWHGKAIHAIINDASKSMKPEMKALKKQPEFQTREAKKAIKKHWAEGPKSKDPIAAKYNTEASKIYMKHVKAVSSKHLKVSPSGKWEEELVVGKGIWNVQLKRTDGATHSGISDPDISFMVRPIVDEDGFIIDFEEVSMSQSDIGREATEALIHYGVKGMKWGVRRAERNSPRVTVTTRKRLGTIKTTGGKGRKPSADATRAAVNRQISKKSGHQALTNAQLKQMIERMELEKRAGNLERERSIGAQFVKALLNEK